MNPLDQAGILKFHRRCIRRFGEGTPGALGWEAEEDQERRFELLCGIGDLRGRSVLDVGCGHGDLRKHLLERFPEALYSGIEHLPDFLEVAVRRYGDWPGTTFYLGDFTTARLEVFDYVLASGSLNYRSSEPDWVFRMIEKMFTLCRWGLAFNLLSHVRDPRGMLAAYDPEIVLARCRELAPGVSCRRGDLENEFTVFLRRGEEDRSGITRGRLRS